MLPSVQIVVYIPEVHVPWMCQNGQILYTFRMEEDGFVFGFGGITRKMGEGGYNKILIRQ